MSTLFSDDFTRANAANLGSNWDADDSGINVDWDLDTNTAECQNTASNGQHTRTTTSAHAATADVLVSAAQVSASGDGGVFARCTAVPYTGLVAYWVSCASNNIDLYKSNGSGDVLKIAGGAITQVAGGVIKMSCKTNGANCDLELWYQGTSKGTASDNTSPLTTAGRTGMTNWAALGTASRYDNFLVEDFSGGATAWGPLLGLCNNRLVQR